MFHIAGSWENEPSQWVAASGSSGQSGENERQANSCVDPVRNFLFRII